MADTDLEQYYPDFFLFPKFVMDFDKRDYFGQFFEKVKQAQHIKTAITYSFLMLKSSVALLIVIPK